MYAYQTHHMNKKILIFILAAIIFVVSFLIANFLNLPSLFKRQNNIPEIEKGPIVQNGEQSTQDIPQLSTVAKNLEVPWAIAFLPNGNMLVTERKGRIRQVDASGELLDKPPAVIEQVKQIGEGGLHGITLHPDFETNHFIYLYYTYGQVDDQTLNRVSRFTFENSTLSSEKVIVDGIPGAPLHDGGRIKFGPDKFLYITTGDALDPSLAQNKLTLAGKILRVTDDGKSAPGNPFNTPIYSYGHRNPQGIAWDSENRLWETEHGQSATDELNLIQAGANYGWPTIRGDETKENLKSPIKHSGSETWAPAGLAYLNGSLYFGGLRGQALFEAKIEGNSVTLKEHLKGQLGRIREVIVGPDNMLYISTSNRDGRGVPTSDDDRIIRVNPAKL